MSRFFLTYSSRPENLDKLFEDLGLLLEQEQVEPDLHHPVQLAVSEAFTNALVHGNANCPDKSINISIMVNGEEIRADISDEGEGGLERVRNRRPCQVLAESGRGIGLIEHYADAVSYAETNSGGLVVSVLFHRTEKVIISDS